MSHLTPLLESAGVSLIGIGFDSTGYAVREGGSSHCHIIHITPLNVHGIIIGTLQEFKGGNYFSGKIYLDPSQKLYSSMGLDRVR